MTLGSRWQNEPSCDQSVFNDDKINVIEMPGDLIVAANVDKSEINHTLTEASRLFYRCFALLLVLCGFFFFPFKASNGAFQKEQGEVTTFDREPNVSRTWQPPNRVLLRWTRSRIHGCRCESSEERDEESVWVGAEPEQTPGRHRWGNHFNPNPCSVMTTASNQWMCCVEHPSDLQPITREARWDLDKSLANHRAHIHTHIHT